MRIVATELEGVYLIEHEPVSDPRGSFSRLWCQRALDEHGLRVEWRQCNLSHNSRRGTLRGMHFQEAPFGETKLIHVVRGALFDVVVDVRPQSRSHGKALATKLSADRPRALYVPPGCAHGFLTLEDHTDVLYHMSEFYHPAAARGFHWNSRRLSDVWPEPPRVVSARDEAWPDLADCGAPIAGEC